MRSLTRGIQPPHPVPAFVHFFIPSNVSVPPSDTALQMSFLEILSQLQINASSGRPVTPDKFPVSLDFALTMSDSGSGGSASLFLQICDSMRYSLASPTNIPP